MVTNSTNASSTSSWCFWIFSIFKSPEDQRWAWCAEDKVGIALHFNTAFRHTLTLEVSKALLLRIHPPCLILPLLQILIIQDHILGPECFYLLGHIRTEELQADNQAEIKQPTNHRVVLHLDSSRLLTHVTDSVSLCHPPRLGWRNGRLQNFYFTPTTQVNLREFHITYNISLNL